jgi:hypothetical protein
MKREKETQFDELLNSYRWLEQERASASGPDREQVRAQIDRELERLFAEIMGHATTDSAEAVTRLQLIVDQLERLAHDRDRAADLSLLFRGHLSIMRERLLVAAASSAGPPSVVQHLAMRRFETSSVRGAFVDRSYRYRHTNISNAIWHRAMPSAFVDRPAWHVVTKRYFEQMMRPSIDRCFEGERVNYSVRLKARDRYHFVDIELEPLIDDDPKRIAYVAVSGREFDPRTRATDTVDYETKKVLKIARILSRGNERTGRGAESARDSSAR